MSATTTQPVIGPRPTTTELERMYELMHVMTLAGTKAREEAVAGRLQAAFYPVRGLEGVCAALGIAMEESDLLVSTYRNLGDAVAKGSSLRRVIAEIYGRIDGTSKGKGGPMHLHDQEAGFVTSTGIVGAGLPIGAGLGLAAKLDGARRAVVTTFGDGSTSIGAWHEAMNLISLWKLPVVLVCQNNMWGEHTPIKEYAASTDLAGRAASYGMPSLVVDGFDPLATLATLRTALERARAGEGPTFVECQTYRLGGHSGSADYSYMPQDEFDAAMQRDPAPSFRSFLLRDGVVDEERIVEIETAARAAVDDAFQFAQQSPVPASEEHGRDVFADEHLHPLR